MSIEKSAIAKNIKRFRTKQKISQDKLSKLADVAYNTVIKLNLAI